MDLASISLLEVWRRLGGSEPRGRRAPAFWRKSRDLNVSLDPDHGRWYDFAGNVGGGIVALVETALNCDHAAALLWLKREQFIEPRRPLSAEERRQYARRREAEEREIENAELFAIAAVAIAEQLLQDDPLVHPARPHLTALVCELRHDRREVYREFKLDRPKLAEALVFAGRMECVRREEFAAHELGGLLRNGA